MNDFSVWPIAEASQLGEVRRYAARLAREIGFDETETGKVSIMVTEAATNVLKHGKGGEILLRARSAAWGEAPGLEVLALDKGPGIADIQQAFRDGYSTAGSSGTGLGAISRLASSFEAFSAPGLGTALVADLHLKTSLPVKVEDRFDLGAICVPKPGEILSGDAWLAQPQPDGLQVMVVDGLGHGPLAADTAQAAIAVFTHQPNLAPAQLVEACHAAMHNTRGAALAVARLDLRQAQVIFAGIGNIVAGIWSPSGLRSLLSHNGIVGHQMHRVQEYNYPWPVDGLLMMHSDGLSTQVKLGTYPGLTHRHPSLIAGILYRDFRRERDDASVVIVRQRRK